MTDPFMRSSPRAQKPAGSKAPPPVPISRDDPENIKKQIQKGFDLAHPDSIPSNPREAKANTITSTERNAWEFPKHPDNHRLTALESYAIVPDLETGTDMASNWQALKFDKPPLPPLKNGRRDDRIDVGLLMASENPALMPEWRARKKAHDSQPDNFEDPGPEPYTWSLSVPKQTDSTPRIRQLFDDSNPSKDDTSLMKPLLEESADGSLRLPFERIRVYTDATRQEVDPRRVVALSLVKPSNLPQHSRFRKHGTSPSAYYYPIYERVKMKADRGQLSKKARNTRLGAGPEVEEDLPDQMMVLFREPDAKEKHIRHEFRGRNDQTFAKSTQWDELTKDAQAQEEAEQAEMTEQGEGQGDVSMAEGDDAEGETNGVERKNRNGDRDIHPPVNGHGVDTGGGEADADAEEDEDMEDD
jgi:RNA polymerase II-associated factor 1